MSVLLRHAESAGVGRVAGETLSCGGTLTPGTLNTGNVRYTQTYAYDTLNRLTTGPKGSGYTYGDTNHLDALTVAPSYTASYDTAGDMPGRSGNVLGYNALRQLITWQNQATSPTQTASYAYNGSGERVQQSVTSSGTTTTNETAIMMKRIPLHCPYDTFIA